MFSKKISFHNHYLLPVQQHVAGAAEICRQCHFVSEREYTFCTNCGYPLHNETLEKNFFKNRQYRKEQLYKAESAVATARIILYIIAGCLLVGLLFLFSASSARFFIATLAASLSALFFFIAIWSKHKPFSAMLTAFIILITFSAVDLFDKIVASFTTTQGISSLFISFAILFLITRGVQGAYRATLLKEELQYKP